MFDREKLKNFKGFEVKKVECPEWADMGEVYVRGMSGHSRDAYEMAIYNESQKKDGSFNMRANMVVACACDKDGNLIFEASDSEWLGNQSAAVLDRIHDVARKLSGMTDQDVEDLEKSLEADQS